MRNNKAGLFATLLITILIVGCKQDEMMMYEQNAGVYFNGVQPSYTFFENPDKVDIGYDSVYAALKITGSAVNYDRYVEVEVVDTSRNHTALAKMYSFEKGIIKANEYVGSIPFRINYTKELDDSAHVVVLRILPSKEFPVTDLNRKLGHITFGNVAMKPENWSELSRVFGDYSHSWYAFILKASGRKNLPCKYVSGWAQAGITPEEAERWPMTRAEVRAIGYQVKEVLVEYNNTHSEPLKHEDGEFKDQNVKMKI